MQRWIIQRQNSIGQSTGELHGAPIYPVLEPSQPHTYQRQKTCYNQHYWVLIFTVNHAIDWESHWKHFQFQFWKIEKLDEIKPLPKDNSKSKKPHWEVNKRRGWKRSTFKKEWIAKLASPCWRQRSHQLRICQIIFWRCVDTQS